jgi:N-acetylmuramoyl-L-alanine amidase
MSQAKNDKLKATILREVFEENLRIDAPGPRQRSRIVREGRKLIRLAPLLLGCLALAVFFLLEPDQPKPTPELPSTSQTIFPWHEIIYTPHLLADTPVPLPRVSFDASRLLNYDLLLNRQDVRLRSVFGLESRTIVIDPGHGGRDPGAIGNQGTMEKDIVLDIARRLKKELDKNSLYNVLLTREDDTFVSLAERVAFANRHRADLFISLHINALPQKEFNVTETYYFGPPSDIHTLRLAEQENRGSEIKTGDFKDMIKKIGNVLKEQESATLATTIQHNLFSNLKKYDRIIADRGIKIAPFVVLLGVEAPSVLVEISCISKNEEEANLNSAAYREKITTSLEKGINAYLGRPQTQVVKGEKNGKEIGNQNS